MITQLLIDGNNLTRENSNGVKGNFPKYERIIPTIVFFQKLGLRVKVFVSSALKYRIDRRGKREGQQFRELIKKSPFIQETPAGIDDDEFILEAAAEFNAHILSNDRYREYNGLYKNVIKRRIPFMIVDERIIIPKRFLT